MPPKLRPALSFFCRLIPASAFVLACPVPADGEKTQAPNRPEATPTPLRQAHAHNDYEHKRPLLDALAHGFCSVEADIFLVDGALLVAHERRDLKPGRTLERLYLEPLSALAAKNGGRIFPGGPTFTLLIDIKTDGEATYRALAQLLGRYREILTEIVDGKVTERAVTAIVSGNRARDLIAATDPRHVGIDGRLSDLGSDLPSHLLPLISDRWTRVFSWRGKGPIPEEERSKLEKIVTSAHGSGRRVRFWATPESPAVWGELLSAGVDLINTDDLAGLRDFLAERATQ